MNNAIFKFDTPQNEPARGYAPGSHETESLIAEIQRQSSIEVEIPLIIGGKEIKTGNTGKVVMPHDHGH
ncbi:MAG: 1-pyrroline-5-carboxylate dehydrogenase, partial [Synergistaceae bacterium]|nr:1-pyrroline-5-carboxylate dehydrogenase [Synergistaceae bacterium]